MGLIFTSYTHKRNASLIYLFKPVWCLVISFNLGALLITDTNQCYFKLVFFHLRKTSGQKTLTEESENLGLGICCVTHKLGLLAQVLVPL